MIGGLQREWEQGAMETSRGRHWGRREGGTLSNNAGMQAPTPGARSTAVGVVLATVADSHFGSRSWSNPNCCHIGGPGCQYTGNVNLATVRW